MSRQPDPHDDSCGGWWGNEDGDYWVCAVTFATPEAAAAEIIDQTSDDEQVLVCYGRTVQSVTDCSFDGCDVHDGDCPYVWRDTWAFQSYSHWGNSWADVEDEIAAGRKVFPGSALVIRDKQVHWADDCECERCDVRPVPVYEAPSVPMFPEAE